MGVGEGGSGVGVKVGSGVRVGGGVATETAGELGIQANVITKSKTAKSHRLTRLEPGLSFLFLPKNCLDDLINFTTLIRCKSSINF
jgi:hypothetical protein